ncbi:hypothetical protein [Embleya sp. NPDC020630]|uniref:hypothetical protein n=1 Tax=Embleya sp. NPDC020630 TaxID=3363979 RepID=UPI0037BE167C
MRRAAAGRGPAWQNARYAPRRRPLRRAARIATARAKRTAKNYTNGAISTAKATGRNIARRGVAGYINSRSALSRGSNRVKSYRNTVVSAAKHYASTAFEAVKNYALDKALEKYNEYLDARDTLDRAVNSVKTTAKRYTNTAISAAKTHGRSVARRGAAAYINAAAPGLPGPNRPMYRVPLNTRPMNTRPMNTRSQINREPGRARAFLGNLARNGGQFFVRVGQGIRDRVNDFRASRSAAKAAKNNRASAAESSRRRSAAIQGRNAATGRAAAGRGPARTPAPPVTPRMSPTRTTAARGNQVPDRVRVASRPTGRARAAAGASTSHNARLRRVAGATQDAARQRQREQGRGLER